MRSNRGMSMIELLIVVAIIGILAAAAVWNYLIALDKGKQKKSMADIRSISAAWEARATEYGRYNAASEVFPWPGEDLSMTEMTTQLSPTYMRNIPERDGWGNPFEFALDLPVGNIDPANVYAVRSLGKDGLPDASSVVGTTKLFECDIVFSNGVFLVSPEVK